MESVGLGLFLQLRRFRYCEKRRIFLSKISVNYSDLCRKKSLCYNLYKINVYQAFPFGKPIMTNSVRLPIVENRKMYI